MPALGTDGVPGAVRKEEMVFIGDVGHEERQIEWLAKHRSPIGVEIEIVRHRYFTEWLDIIRREPELNQEALCTLGQQMPA